MLGWDSASGISTARASQDHARQSKWSEELMLMRVRFGHVFGLPA
jgi:hypothetical protein